MKRLIVAALALAMMMAGCATTVPNGANQVANVNEPHGIYSDPTYPGPGLHFGIGLGRWGGQRGAGVGFGLGF